jgi:hypothetical protein
MSDSPLYESMRAFIRSEIAFQVLAAKTELRSSLTSEAPKIIEGPPGKDGRDGKDARGIASVETRDGRLILRFTDNTEQDVGRIVGEKGEPGERGADGIGKEGTPGKDGAPSTIPGPKGDTGERGADGIATREEIVSIVEERVGEIQVRTFADVYQGVYENGRLYERGLLTTWGGSLWLSQAETRSKPGESADWKLVVKKGADGKK